ncbi:MAG: hypothetical protein IPG50_28335 [Myxococcales bacterium]|nr:hypothetical protein [Myxococcales bacterium]
MACTNSPAHDSTRGGLDLTAIGSVAKDLDGVVFVADSQPARQVANVDAMRLLEGHPKLRDAPAALLYTRATWPMS